MSLAAEVLPGLKSFQRRTVEHAFHRLYDAPDSTRRFLVADEVGLGKTMVARGVVAKAIDRLRAEKVERIDVIYVCSNQVIARQNISKLDVTGAKHDPVLDRVTMLPARLRDLSKHEINLIPLTPYTSLDLRSNVGARRERVVLWLLLRELYGEDKMARKGRKRVLQGPCQSVESFERGLRWDPDWWGRRPLDRDLSRRFIQALRTERKENGDESILARFDDLSERMRRKRKDEPRWEANQLVGDMRRLLARTSIAALEADLIILDEFQRFRNLMDPDDRNSELAQLLFEQEDARILMLSATPYKMLTRNAEAEEDHHRDFLATIDFLSRRDGKVKPRCAELLGEARRGLRSLPEGRKQVLTAKEGLEELLGGVMARTERVTNEGDRNGMIAVRVSEGCELTAADVAGFGALDRVARAIEHPDTVEYWKSTPYPLNFMDSYKLANDYAAEAEGTPAARLKAGRLDTKGIEKFAKVDLGNPRLRALANDTVDRNLWRLLWLPPSMPYYRPGKPFDRFEGTNPTKRLVFSAWNVVPKAVSLMLSYEAERRAVALDKPRANTPEGRKSVSQLLRIALSSETGEPATMPTLAILFPSLVVAKLGDPLTFAKANGNSLPTIAAVKREVMKNLRPRIAQLTNRVEGGGRADTAWYSAVPLLLEAEEYGADHVVEWLESDEIRSVVSARDKSDGSAWTAHLDAAAHIVRTGGAELGEAPSDLAEVEALMALGAFGTTTARGLGRVAEQPDPACVRTRALKVADALRGMFNWPEIIPLVKDTDPSERYWQDTIQYCVNGNLQATLDEYAHMLSEWAPIPGEKTPNDVVEGVSEAMLEALALHGSDFEVRKIDRRGIPRKQTLKMRPRFAIRFADPKAAEDAQVDRAINVRASFNSPFWPFVLISTSVGQEGLDFHLYCHAVVHWNLPSNPVDFEQREGRVHRYKGHAVRLNAAAAHRDAALANGHRDPWAAIFDKAPAGHDDLQPFWLLDGDAKVLRFVPTLPSSRDIEREQQLMRLLASYRLAFGQPRQDDLLAYLGKLDLDPELIRELTVDLRPPT